MHIDITQLEATEVPHISDYSAAGTSGTAHHSVPSSTRAIYQEPPERIGTNTSCTCGRPWVPQFHQ